MAEIATWSMINSKTGYGSSGAYENIHNDLSVKDSLLEGGLPSLIGGLIIWLCFLLA